MLANLVPPDGAFLRAGAGSIRHLSGEKWGDYVLFNQQPCYRRQLVDDRALRSIHQEAGSR